MKIRDKIADIIIEKRLQGKDIPLWIKWLFPNVVEEVDPIARMLKGNKEPVKRTNASPVYKLAYATIAVILIVALSLFIWAPHSGNRVALQKGGKYMENVETYKSDESGVKGNTVRTLVAPATASTSTTASTATTASETVKDKIKGDLEQKNDCGPGKKCITDPVLPPKEEK